MTRNPGMTRHHPYTRATLAPHRPSPSRPRSHCRTRPQRRHIATTNRLELSPSNLAQRSRTHATVTSRRRRPRAPRRGDLADPPPLAQAQVRPQPRPLPLVAPSPVGEELSWSTIAIGKLRSVGAGFTRAPRRCG
jgi:hypothetical protein